VNQWFAVYVLTRHEKAVSSMLENKGYNICLPLIRSKREWCDRTKWLDIPAFPGYVFCEFEPERRVPILNVPGVLNIVGAGRVPMPIPPEEIARRAMAILGGGPVGPYRGRRARWIERNFGELQEGEPRRSIRQPSATLSSDRSR
jgi:transcription antitermination factor NusG